ncbi:MAG: hypothetical protein NXI32_15295 [bacterium]|nr:hypothetical protein [bacterium]
MVRGRKKVRGIFAIEGEWYSDLRHGVSFRPILEVINKLNRSPYVHRDAATREELFYYLTKWTQKRYSSYPILHLGFHGIRESILIGDGRSSLCQVTLDELMDHMDGACSKRIIYFGSCETMNIDGRRLKSFLRKTDALAVCGYRFQVDMLKSAAFELLLFDALLCHTLTLQGVRAMERMIRETGGSLCRELGFRMVIRGAG